MKYLSALVAMSFISLFTAQSLSQTYDWTGCDWMALIEKDGIAILNNRWAGETGCIFAKFGPPTFTWWTTHNGQGNPNYPISEPFAGIGVGWGDMFNPSSTV
jgi:hypothetical protein